MGDIQQDQTLDPASVVTIDGDLFTTSPIQAAATAKLHADLAALPADKHLAIIVAGDAQGVASASIVARAGNHFAFVAGGTYQLKEKRPAGYLALEASF